MRELFQNCQTRAPDGKTRFQHGRRHQDLFTILTREQQNKRRNEFLIHACQCRDPTCAKPLCIKMKQLLRHARDCKMRSSGKCTACNFFIRICVMHAQECREIKCPVPICPNLKQKMRERRQREQKRSYELARRRMRKMNQQASPTAATSNKETPTPATTKPAPSPATPQPMTAPTSGKAGAIGSPNPHTPKSSHTYNNTGQSSWSTDKSEHSICSCYSTEQTTSREWST